MTLIAIFLAFLFAFPQDGTFKIADTPIGKTVPLEFNISNGLDAAVRVKKLAWIGPDAADFKLAPDSPCHVGSVVKAHGACKVKSLFTRSAPPRDEKANLSWDVDTIAVDGKT